MKARFGLDQDLELHDAYHVEVKRDYPVTWNGGPGSYVVDSYIFLPYSFGIAPDTFPAESLFGLTTSYLRWRDDDFTYEEFMDRVSPRSPLARLERGLVQAFERPGKTLELAHEARFAGCAGRVFLKGQSAQLVADLRALEQQGSRRTPLDPAAAPRAREEVSRYLDRADALLERVRRASLLAQQGSEVLHPDVVRATRLVDEYLSTIFDQILAQLYEAVSQAQVLQDGRGGRAALAARLKDVARRESIYRGRAGYCSLDVESQQLRELYGFRLSLLKKYVSKPLYLDVTTTRPKPTALQHVVGAVAAAIAAAWAVGIQIYIFANNVPPSGNGPYPSDSVGKTAVSAVTAALFAAAVLAYVLKDRMKVFINESVMKRLRGKMPDRDVYLSEAGPEGTSGAGREIGRIREQVRFVPSASVPEEVDLVRNLGHTVDLGEERLEVVLHHQRTVDLEPAFAHSPERAVRDILRLNVAPFLERLADPDQEVHHFDGRLDSFVTRTAPRVYHLNLIFRLAPLRLDAGPVRYERIRVVLTQRGIIRVEEAVPLGTLEDVRSLRHAATRVAGGIFDAPL
jgi:hypothetical protein